MRTFHDPAQAIRVRIDETFAIELSGNPTTGYTWQPQGTAPGLKLIDHHLLPAGGGIGAGGREQFRFQALEPGQGEIAFAYRRPWERRARDSRRFWVIVEGGPAGAAAEEPPQNSRPG